MTEQIDYFCPKHPKVKLTDLAGPVGHCRECAEYMVGKRPLVEKKRAEFDRMTPAARMDFIKSGGIVVN